MSLYLFFIYLFIAFSYYVPPLNQLKVAVKGDIMKRQKLVVGCNKINPTENDEYMCSLFMIFSTTIAGTFFIAQLSEKKISNNQT